MKIKTGLLLLLVFPGLSFLGASPGYSLDIIALASGGDHTVALRIDRTAWTWGRNANGQLGDGSWTNKNVPTRVAMLRDIVSVAAGDAHSLAVRADGTVWAWGWNANGQLGNGTTTDQPTPVQVKDPSDSSGFLSGVIAVAAGERHSLALKANGAVWAWGYGANGQLGDGTWEWRPAPVHVKDPTDASGFLTGVKAIAAGSLHSIALKNDKTIWTWGSQAYMQLGRNSSSPPQNVAGQVAGMTEVKAIAGGWEHTVVLKENGIVWAAGRNLEGQLGDGTTIGSSLSPLKLFVQVIDSTDPTGYLTGIDAIGADDRHTVAVKQNGSMYGWGWNYGGKLCDSITDTKLTPMKMKDNPTTFLSGVASVAAGGVFNLMPKGDGTIWGCGYNYYGQLGDGTWTSPRMAPVQTVMPPIKLVYLWGLGYIVPGEEATFLVDYENLNETALDQAVVVVNFPKTFKYVSSTGGGINRDDQPTNQVFWKLGNIPVRAKGQVTVKVEVPWGMPLHTFNMAAVELGARNTTPRFDLEEYLVWQPNLVSETKLTPVDIEQQLIQDPKLQALLQYATKTMGRYVFLSVAKRFEYRDGTGMTCLTLLDTQSFGPAFLYSNGQAASIEKFEGSKKIRFDSQGGYSEDLVDGSVQVWGRWAETTGILPGAQASATTPNLGDTSPSQPVARCMMNCMVNREFHSLENVSAYMDNKNNNLRMACKLCSDSLTMFEIDINSLDVQACTSCMETWKNSDDKFSEAALGCVYECQRDPSHHICTGKGKRFCYYPGLFAYFLGFLGFSEGDTGIIAALKVCDSDTTGTYQPRVRWKACNSALFQECKNGVCMSDANCDTSQPEEADLLSLNFPGLISNGDLAGPAGCPIEYINTLLFETRTAHDPNIKSSNVKGDVLPGETVTYTVEYENLGAGTAYGVYILDPLDSNLDESTLAINNSGSYRPPTRLLTWDIGTVAPGGKGSVSFSVKVKAGVAAGTSLVNRADVYFPSANEITPTNAIIHQVRGLVANPQTLNAVSGSPLSLTLTGKDSGSRPLTFQITSPPGFGTLTGTPPALTYTSMEEFIGQDAFAFAVNNGLETSPPALIKVNVSVNPQDTKPPKVTGTSPKAGAAGVHVTATPIQSNPNRFAPQITATFSEPLDDSTVTGTTFTLNGGLTGQVFYDELTRTAYYIPTKALNYSTTYTARLTTGTKDKKGNPLAAEYSWQFTTESLINLQVALPDLANEINFGDQAVNILSPVKTVSLASTGIQNLNIGTVSVIGANSNDFKVVGDTCSGKTFTPSQNCTVQVAFQPISAGQRTGSLSIPSNDPDLPSATIVLKGEGIGSGPPWFIWLPLIMQP
jgi:uncharacterized repeat protein (TIGR01451 family)